MKLGYYISLGNLVNKSGIANKAVLDWATELRQSGAGFCMFTGLSLDPVMVRREPDKLTAIITAANEQLAALETIGMGVCVRPKPEIVEQIKVTASFTDTTPPAIEIVPTPNFHLHRTSIDVLKRLVFRPGQYPFVVHEIHDLMNGHWRALLCRESFGRDSVLYWGLRGPWIKEGADFGEHDEPHVVHVALNAASATDPSSSDASPSPEQCTGADILGQVRRIEERVNERLMTHPGYRFIAHINTTPDVSVGRLVSMLAAARTFFGGWDVLMLRLVNDGQTLADANGKHVVTPNVLEAVKECASWMRGW